MRISTTSTLASRGQRNARDVATFLGHSHGLRGRLVLTMRSPASSLDFFESSHVPEALSSRAGAADATDPAEERQESFLQLWFQVDDRLADLDAVEREQRRIQRLTTRQRLENSLVRRLLTAYAKWLDEVRREWDMPDPRDT